MSKCPRFPVTAHNLSVAQRARRPRVPEDMVTRRGVLLSGIAGVGLLGAGFVGSIEGVLPGGVQLRRALGLVGTDGTVPDVPPADTRAQRFHSAARGCEVNVVTMGAARNLPVCVVLHGRGSNAEGMVSLGLPKFLTAAIRAGAAPFTLVAIDGGDSYWVARKAADDPQAMLREELPVWLAGLGLAAPRAVLGISMGCFGGLQYAHGLDAAAVLSPAVFRSWEDARTVDAFADEQQWAANEPLRHPLPDKVKLGVWCGMEDPFYPSATQLATQTRAAVARFDHGVHTGGYWCRVLPDALNFLSGSLRG